MTAHFKFDEPTRTKETEEAYLKCYQTLRNRFIDKTGDANLTAEDVVVQLLLMREELCMATWRRYKSAVLFVMNSRFGQFSVAIDALEQANSVGLAKTSTRTSGRKLKEVPDKEWLMLQKELKKRAQKQHKNAQGLLDVLRATLLTGLRPNEWCFSEISMDAVSDRPVLKIRNSKHTNGRGNGEYRELFIDSLDQNEIGIIKRALIFCDIKGDNIVGKKKRTAVTIELSLKNELENARDAAIASAGKSISSISLYSFRHQFISDAKATYKDPIIIAAMVGHSSTRTAFSHYGKRVNAKGTVKVTPTITSINAVLTVRSELYHDFVSQKRNDVTPSMR